MSGFWGLMAADIRLHRRQMTGWAALLLFFLVVILLLPFALGPEPGLLKRLAPGLIWLAVLLMSFLALERLFIEDARDGTLDLLLLSDVPLPLIVFSRLAALALMILLALVFVLPLAALLLGMSLAVLPVLLLSLLLGVPSLVLLGGIAGGITVALNRHPALLTVLLVPFYIPVLIFAAAACDAALLGVSALPHLLLLGAVLVFLLPVAPFVIAAALRNAQS